jgi:4-hydroxythreonine-4-phosphate dehydrogenase
MLIWCQELAVVPVTIHVPLAEVPRLLTSELIMETARIVAHDLARRFGIERPRLAVCGLNPHAGERGMIGREDEDVVRPAVEQLRKGGLLVTGPHPADTLFHQEARGRYDVALGMYHDQVLTPIKTLAFERAVNVTLGLPFVRTSPDHGTAFDLAGSGRADPRSLLAALKLARRLAEAGTPAPVE